MHSLKPTNEVPKKHTGIKRIVKAGGYSMQGLSATWKSEAAFRQECFLAILIIPVLFFFDLSSLQRILLVGSTTLVLITELLNSSIEALVDRVGLEYNELSGKAKDIGSAAVLLSLILWAYVWIEVFVFQ